MPKQPILLVEDEPNLLNSLAFILAEHGHPVLKAATGECGVELALQHDPKLIFLDIDLPGIDGFEVAEQLAPLREKGAKIVMLTGSDVEEDILRALRGLADDYIVKPVRPRVLLARIDLILGRDVERHSSSKILLGELAIDPAAFEASLGGQPLNLTPSELNILLLLANAPGKTFRRNEIIEAVRGKDCHLTDRAIDFQIHGLRHKLRDAGSMIVTVRGVGFKLKAP